MEDSIMHSAEPFAVPQTAEDFITLNGKRLDYSVCAEEIPVCDDSGAEQARSFCVSYALKDGTADRPVTFAFNGKPGTSTLYLHMAALAPKTYSLSGQGDAAPERPFKVSDNRNTILDFSDIVLIDPVGTGFSRVTNHEKERQYYGTLIPNKADKFLKMLQKWDEAGGNDNGEE